MVDKPQLEQDLEYIELGQREGARLAIGGERLKRQTDGYYLAPALFVDATNAMRISREEIFGPVACVIRASDYEEALAIANDTEFGLSLGHRHHLAEVRVALQAARAGRDGDGESADRRASTTTCRSAAAKRRATARASRDATPRSSTRR